MKLLFELIILLDLSLLFTSLLIEFFICGVYVLIQSLDLPCQIVYFEVVEFEKLSKLDFLHLEHLHLLLLRSVFHFINVVHHFLHRP